MWGKGARVDVNGVLPDRLDDRDARPGEVFPERRDLADTEGEVVLSRSTGPMERIRSTTLTRHGSGESSRMNRYPNLFSIGTSRARDAK